MAAGAYQPGPVDDGIQLKQGVVMKNLNWGRGLLWLQVLLLALLLLGMLGNKFAWMPFPDGFRLFMNAFKVLLASTAIAALLAGLYLWKRPLSLRSTPIALGLGFVPLALVFALIGPGLKVPAIHNISTDLERPPAFVAAHGITDRLNDLAPASAADRAAQRAYYDLAPLMLAAAPADVHARALAQVRALGWTLIAEDVRQGRIEATAESLFFGFRDDVVIRIEAAGEGSRVDMRSVSRVGKSDLGANARRIKAFLGALAADYSS